MADAMCKANTTTRWERSRDRMRYAVRLWWAGCPPRGYAYRKWQRYIHARGRCVLRRTDLPLEDGKRLWKCTWCGNSAWQRSSPDLLAALQASIDRRTAQTPTEED